MVKTRNAAPANEPDDELNSGEDLDNQNEPSTERKHPNLPDQQGCFDQGQQGYYVQQADHESSYDQSEGQQGYYDQEQVGQEGYYDQGQQGYYYDQSIEEIIKSKRKIASVKDYFDDMLASGHIIATDGEKSNFMPDSGYQKSDSDLVCSQQCDDEVDPSFRERVTFFQRLKTTLRRWFKFWSDGKA